jgi:hypothetical protein
MENGTAKRRFRLTVNASLTLATIPPAAFDYRLGNRSALEWVIDQYQVSTDKRSGITSNPNRADEERIHRPPRRPGHPRQRGDGENREGTPHRVRASGGLGTLTRRASEGVHQRRVSDVCCSRRGIHTLARASG